MGFTINDMFLKSLDGSLGTGQISGNFYRDKMYLGDSICIDANFISANKETTEPFQEIPFDGIMGLGFKDMCVYLYIYMHTYTYTSKVLA